MPFRRTTARGVESDGRKHARITWALALPAGVACALLPLPGPWWLRLTAGGLGCLLGLFLSPDLDQEMLTHSEWLLLKLPWVGWLVGTLWVAYWLPYALMSKHRGLSHWPVLGTLGRCLYLTPLLWGMVRLSGWGWSPMLTEPFVSGCLALVLGLMVSDLGHWARDYWGWEL